MTIPERPDDDGWSEEDDLPDWLESLDDLDEADIASVARQLGRFEPREIPETLHSVYSGLPFEKCLICEGILAESPLGYQINKSYRGHEVVMEAAICAACSCRMAEDYSEDSLRVVHAFVHELLRNAHEDPQVCLSCSSTLADRRGYTAVAECNATLLVLPPIVVCVDCEESLHERLSQKTRDRLEEFVRDYFPTVPEGIDLTPTPRVLPL